MSLNAVLRLVVGPQTPGQRMQHHEHLVARGRRPGYVLPGASQAVAGTEGENVWGKKVMGKRERWRESFMGCSPCPNSHPTFISGGISRGC